MIKIKGFTRNEKKYQVYYFEITDQLSLSNIYFTERNTVNKYYR